MRCATQIERLRCWADDRAIWLAREDLGEVHRGRREHDVIGDGGGEIVFKITRGAGFGLAPSAREVVSGFVSDWFAIQPATPRQYLERLCLTNQLYPGLNALEGFCEIDGRFAIVTSQPFVSGRNATAREIRDFLTPRGFVKLCEATWYRREDALALFDVDRSNLFADEAGNLVPIDLIPVRTSSGALHETLEKAFERVHRKG